jgi:hypothetical protein
MEQFTWALGPLAGRAPLATWRAAVVLDAHHNISPRLRKQLVLELEVGVVVAELLELLTGSVLLAQTTPLNADEPHLAT